MSDLRDKTIKGLSWSALSQVGRQVLNLALMLVLVRLLSPHEFGLVAMITVITGFATLFIELGFSEALIQKQHIRQIHLSSVFWLNVGSGTLLTALFFGGAPLIGAFYEEPLLVPVTMLIAFNFLILSLGGVQRALLTKKIDFKALSIVQIFSTGGAGVVAVFMAFSGFGVWSLAVQSLLSAALETFLLWHLCPWRPTFMIQWAAVRELLGFSLNLLGERTLNYWVRNTDDLLIGKVIGAGALGLYSRAYMIMLFPLQNISQVIARVMFPSFSLIQDDSARIKHIFLYITRTIALLTFPLMLGLFVTAESFVLVLFGPPWSAMTPILRIFCFLGLLQSIGTLKGNLFMAKGRTDLQFRINLIGKPILIGAIIAGVQWGIMGVAIAYAITSFLVSLPEYYFAGRLIGLRIIELARNLSSIFICAAIMSSFIFGFDQMLPERWSSVAHLAVEIPVGIAIYWGMLHIFKLKGYQEVRIMLVEQWHHLIERLHPLPQ